jgi:hypothetical protein
MPLIIAEKIFPNVWPHTFLYTSSATYRNQIIGLEFIYTGNGHLQQFLPLFVCLHKGKTPL